MRKVSKQTLFRGDTLLNLLATEMELPEDLLRNSREYPYPYLRGLVMYQMVSEGYGYSEIGRALGRDHSTVLAWERKVEDLISVGFAGASAARDGWNILQRGNHAAEYPLPPEVMETAAICCDVVRSRADLGDISENEYSIITQLITNKIRDHYGCKNLEASR